MNKYLKYLISLLVVFATIANDGILDSQLKSAKYYQVSEVALSGELDFNNSPFYVFNQTKPVLTISFLIPLIYIELRTVFSHGIRLLLELRMFIYQNLQSFINQSVFINEIIISNHFSKSLYKA